MGVIASIRDSADEKINNAFNLATAETMKNYFPRWCEISEVDNPDNIDYTIPCIELESKLCDPRNLKMIRRGKHTQEFLERLTSDQARELYYWRDKDGFSFSDLESPKYLNSIMNGLYLRHPTLRKVFRAWAKED